jgi:riboflavin kinase
MAVMRGRVASGKGDLAQWMRKYAAAYERLTGTRLYPGSLNIVLDDPWELPHDRLRIGAEDVGRNVNLVPCRFLDRAAFLFRTEDDDSKGPEQRRIIEVLADVRLRDAYALSDGDAVTIET